MAHNLPLKSKFKFVKRDSEDYFGFRVLYDDQLVCYVITDIRDGSKVSKCGLKNGGILNSIHKTSYTGKKERLYDKEVKCPKDVDMFLSNAKRATVFYDVIREKKSFFHRLFGGTNPTRTSIDNISKDERGCSDVDKQKIDRNRIGGGIGDDDRVPMSPGTKAMLVVFETPDAAHGIPDAVDSNDKETLDGTKKQLLAATADELNESTECVEESPKPKCVRTDAHSSMTQSQVVKELRDDQKELVKDEMETNKMRRSLIQWEIANKKLEVYERMKNLSAIEQEYAFSLELSNETEFAQARLHVD